MKSYQLLIFLCCIRKFHKPLPILKMFSLQGTLNPYSGQQYLPIYGVSAASNTANQPFSQLNPSISGGGNGYLSVHNYNMPGNQYVQLTGSNFSSASPTARPSIQTPFLVGNVVFFMPCCSIVGYALRQYDMLGPFQKSGNYLSVVSYLCILESFYFVFNVTCPCYPSCFFLA